MTDIKTSDRGDRVRELQAQLERQVAELDHGHLADPPYPGYLATDQRFQRRIEGLHHVHPRRQRRFHLGAGKGAFESAGDDLDLGQLGHREEG